MNRRLLFIQQRWFQVLTAGILLFIGAEQALKITGNPNFLPTVLLVGAFTVPMALVTYFYGRERSLDRELHGETPLAAGATCFLVGGALGVIIAGLIEYGTLRNLGILALLGVAVIEEGSKLVFPVAMYLRGQYRTESDGLLFGVATGMGFAALETMGYGLVALIQSSGDIGTLEEVLLIRGLLSPAGHAAWTGLVCAVLWRERERKEHKVLNIAVAMAFLVAVLLHALWDTINSLDGPTTIQVLAVIIGNVTVAGISLTLLIRRVRESKRYLTGPDSQ